MVWKIKCWYDDLIQNIMDSNFLAQNTRKPKKNRMFLSFTRTQILEVKNKYFVSQEINWNYRRQWKSYWTIPLKHWQHYEKLENCFLYITIIFKIPFHLFCWYKWFSFYLQSLIFSVWLRRKTTDYNETNLKMIKYQ